jgi:hypothetical protein
VRIEKLEYADIKWQSDDAKDHVPRLRVIASSFVSANRPPRGVVLGREAKPGELLHLEYEQKAYTADKLVRTVSLVKHDSKKPTVVVFTVDIAFAGLMTAR